MRRSHRSRASVVVLVLFGVVALCADCLASSRPLLARYHGELQFFPNLTRPAAFPEDLDALDAAMNPGDWYVRAPIPYGPEQSRIAGEIRALASPSVDHPLGTDRAGCDVLARLVHGTRASLGIGLLTALFAALLGVGFGALAGAGGRFADSSISYVAEAFASFPPLVLLCALQGIALGGRAGASSVVTTALALGLVGWPYFFRLVRAEVRRVRALDFVLAARSLGATPSRVALVHLLPAAWPHVATAAAFTVPSAVLLEASLSYLGIGPSPDVASWGELLHQGGLGAARWWLIVFPGAAIFLCAVSFLNLAERVRDALDPRSQALRALHP